MDMNDMSRENYARCTSTAGFNQPLDSWTPNDWMVAIMGEVGEAANFLKKLKRLEDGVPGNAPHETREYLIERIGKELADAYTYIDLLALRLGLVLAEQVVEKFNEVSRRVGYPVQLVEQKPREIATVWHEGSKSFYRARLIVALSENEVAEESQAASAEGQQFFEKSERVMAAIRDFASISDVPAEITVDIPALNTTHLYTLIALRHALQTINETEGGAINDTLWMPHGNQTVFDFLDQAINEASPLPAVEGFVKAKEAEGSGVSEEYGEAFMDGYFVGMDQAAHEYKDTIAELQRQLLQVKTERDSALAAAKWVLGNPGAHPNNVKAVLSPVVGGDNEKSPDSAGE